MNPPQSWAQSQEEIEPVFVFMSCKIKKTFRFMTKVDTISESNKPWYVEYPAAYSSRSLSPGCL